MACSRRAEANEIATSKFVERAQEMMLIGQPTLIFGDDGNTVAVGPYSERIGPFAPSSDIDRAGQRADLMLVKNPAHTHPPLIRTMAGRTSAAALQVTHRPQDDAGTARPLTCKAAALRRGQAFGIRRRIVARGFD